MRNSSRPTLAFLAFFSLAAVARCGGNEKETSSLVGGDASNPAATTTQATITFQFKNTGTGTLYLYNSCVFPFQVTSLSDGETYGNGFMCACNCASDSCTGGLTCGACLPASGYALAAGQVKELTWSAQAVTMQSKTGPYGPFQCVSYAPVPVGGYRVAIAVYASAADAAANANGRSVEQTFMLGIADATVEVSLQ